MEKVSVGGGGGSTKPRILSFDNSFYSEKHVFEKWERETFEISELKDVDTGFSKLTFSPISAARPLSYRKKKYSFFHETRVY